MNLYNITAVSYYNTLPFIHGITHSGFLNHYNLSLDVPSVCARKIADGEAQIGLIPVGALPALHNYQLISNLCIGAVKDVKSVLLLANNSYENLKTIYLDTDSRTSVNLVKILARKFWQISPEWKSVTELKNNLLENEGIVLIGDKTFGLESKYPYVYDLAGEWIKHTQLPFVFAVWVSNEAIEVTFAEKFSKALRWGVDHRNESASLAANMKITTNQFINYVNNDLSYELDSAKMEGMNLFLQLMQQ
jgi:chorismate dehydratase